MKKNILFILLLLLINNFCFSFEEYYLHIKDDTNCIKNISLIIYEESEEIVTGYYKETILFSDNNISTEFTAKKENDRYVFEIIKDSKSKKVFFSYDENYLYYECKISKNTIEDTVFSNFTGQMISLSFLLKQSTISVSIPSTNKSIKEQMYISSDNFILYNEKIQLPSTIEIDRKQITNIDFNDYYTFTLNNHTFLYNVLYYSTDKYKAAYLIYDITDKNNIKTYTLSTLSFDKTPLILFTNNQLIFLEIEYNNDKLINSDFVVKPYLLTENGLVLIECPDDYFYFNTSMNNKNHFEIVKSMKYTKNILLNKGFSINLKILKEASSKTNKPKLYNHYLVISEIINGKDVLKLLILQNTNLIGYYEIPTIPEFVNQMIIFNKKSSFDFSKELPKVLLIDNVEYKLNN